MIFYPDASFLLATLSVEDIHHSRALRFYQRHESKIWVWTPWLRVEVFNAIRQLARSSEEPLISRHAAKALIANLEADVQAGYLSHQETDWRNVLRTANNFSAKHGYDLPCRSADLLHVAYASELRVSDFVTYDEDQAAFAKTCGLKVTSP